MTSSYFALLDSNIFVSSTVRDVFFELAIRNTYKPAWSREIESEVTRARFEHKRIPADKTKLMFVKLNSIFPDSIVTINPTSIGTFGFRDSRDEHVVSAAVNSKTDAIVTFNIDDFPDSLDANLGIDLLHPDNFLLDQLDLFSTEVTSAVAAVIARWNNPKVSALEFAQGLKRAGLPEFSKFVAKNYILIDIAAKK